MVVGKCDDHDRADDDLAVHDDGAFLDGVHTWRQKNERKRGISMGEERRGGHGICEICEIRGRGYGNERDT